MADATHITPRLAQHCSSLQFDDLPEEVVELTKKCILDTIGVAIAAATLAPEAAVLVDYARHLGGRPESSVFGHAFKVPAALAAFINGSLAHLLDFDDEGSGGHLSIATVPTALAISEKLGGVSGRSLITAVAVGMDLHARLARSIRPSEWAMKEGWFATQLFGYLSAAGTAGNLFGLDAAQMENAFGIAYNQMSGSRQMAVGAATDMRSMQAGFSGQGAVLAVELAKRGITGAKSVLEGRYGLFKTYVRSEPDWDSMLRGLGGSFPHVRDHRFRLWPACGNTTLTNLAIQELCRSHSLKASQIERITVVGGRAAMRLLSEPLALKRRPKTATEAKYSLPFVSAVMVVKGTVSLRDFSDEGLRDEAVLAMADRIEYRAASPSPAAGAAEADASPIPWVEIATVSGETFRGQASAGDAKAPLDWPTLEAKFRQCMAAAAKPLEPKELERAIRLVKSLERQSDTADLSSLVGSVGRYTAGDSRV